MSKITIVGLLISIVIGTNTETLSIYSNSKTTALHFSFNYSDLSDPSVFHLFPSDSFTLSMTQGRSEVLSLSPHSFTPLPPGSLISIPTRSHKQIKSLLTSIGSLFSLSLSSLSSSEIEQYQYLIKG